jgi:hypothetical protein
MIKAVLAVALLSLSTAAHDVHVSTTRMAVEGNMAVMRVELFRDDFLKGLRAFTKQPKLQLDAGLAGDSVFLAYAKDRLTLTADGVLLTPVIQGSGEGDARLPELRTWHYEIKYVAKMPIKTLRIRNALLFEMFKDQRNMLKVRGPTGKQKSIVFVPGEAEYQFNW